MFAGWPIPTTVLVLHIKISICTVCSYITCPLSITAGTYCRPAFYDGEPNSSASGKLRGRGIMAERSVLRKDQLEISLHNEKKLIKEGYIKDDNPLDDSEAFRQLCAACRQGDLKVCQEKITEGVNVNARDHYDYTPLILVNIYTPHQASLCGHYEVAQLLLESGALCERDTFQGERCLYNALNDRIRNLLLEYDYSKSTDPLQPLAAHITSLLTRESPVTTDIVVTASDDSVHLHKFILAARSPYFRSKLAATPEATTWKLPSNIAPEGFSAAIKYLYFGEPPRELRSGPGTGFTESDVFAAIDKISKYLETQSLMESILDSGDRRLARQRRTMELARGRDQLEQWFQTNVLGNKVIVETEKASEVKWDRNNQIFADVVLQADELPDEVEDGQPQKSVSDQLVVIDVDCSPDVLEIILTFLYTERADFSLDIAVDVLFAADMLFIEKLKTKAAVVISTLGSAGMSQAEAARTRGKDDDDIDIYAIMRAAWLTRVQRLEEFAARFFAYRLEAHIDTPEFAELIQESASRIQARQETDSIELLDDIRFYLNERFRLRFDDAGLEEMLEETAQPPNGDGGEQPDVAQVTKEVDALNLSSDTTDGQARQLRALDGAMVDDEFSEDAMNYQILMEKLENLLVTLNLDA
ncbi:hypothetical protein N7468_000605 [Penicillium chermesinum]|uniref:BTB domain-containing protein n=1 Tax=Penicillium chermesinum TaxID=63820 RepID=A0A9W9TZ12_9EURO|nr:uncharacterized protein N7468_000605 [Penicillium chermesinum]KAJ5249154.1 hypothetical protein N7468_000605 [Penicillium chermesinum]